jgi:hypothetical protein
MAGDQFYGPKGSGALYLKKGLRIVPSVEGGIQENGRQDIASLKAGKTLYTVFVTDNIKVHV